MFPWKEKPPLDDTKEGAGRLSGWLYRLQSGEQSCETKKWRFHLHPHSTHELWNDIPDQEVFHGARVKDT